MCLLWIHGPYRAQLLVHFNQWINMLGMYAGKYPQAHGVIDCRASHYQLAVNSQSLRSANIHHRCPRLSPPGKAVHKKMVFPPFLAIRRLLLRGQGKAVKPWLICDRRRPAALLFDLPRDTRTSAESFSGPRRSRRRRSWKLFRSNTLSTRPKGLGPGGRRRSVRGPEPRAGGARVPGTEEPPSRFSSSVHGARCGRPSWTPGWSTGRWWDWCSCWGNPARR